MPHSTPLLQTAPWFQRSTGKTINTATINMLGQPFVNAIVAPVWGNVNTGTAWSDHSLNAQFNTLTGTIGRIDGTGVDASTISFIGDGRELATFTIDGNTNPTEISVDVTGVLVLRIQIHVGGWVMNPGARPALANAMIQ